MLKPYAWKASPSGRGGARSATERVSKVGRNGKMDCNGEGQHEQITFFDITIVRFVSAYLRHPFRRPTAATFPEGEGFWACTYPRQIANFGRRGERIRKLSAVRTVRLFFVYRKNNLYNFTTFIDSASSQQRCFRSSCPVATRTCPFTAC